MIKNSEVAMEGLSYVPLLFISCIASLFLMLYCTAVYSASMSKRSTGVLTCKRQIIQGIAAVAATVFVSTITGAYICKGPSSDALSGDVIKSRVSGSSNSVSTFYNFVVVIDSVVLRCLFPLQVIDIFSTLLIRTEEPSGKKTPKGVCMKHIESLVVSTFCGALYLWCLPSGFYNSVVHQRYPVGKSHTLGTILYQVQTRSSPSREEIAQIVFLFLIPSALMCFSMVFGSYVFYKNNRAMKGNLQFASSELFSDYEKGKFSYADTLDRFAPGNMEITRYETVYLMGERIELKVDANSLKATELGESSVGYLAQGTNCFSHSCNCNAFSNYSVFKEHIESMIAFWLLFTAIFLALPGLYDSISLLVYYGYRCMQIFRVQTSPQIAQALFGISHALQSMLDTLGMAKGVVICFAIIFVI